MQRSLNTTDRPRPKPKPNLGLIVGLSLLFVALAVGLGLGLGLGLRKTKPGTSTDTSTSTEPNGAGPFDPRPSGQAPSGNTTQMYGYILALPDNTGTAVSTSGTSTPIADMNNYLGIIFNTQETAEFADSRFQVFLAPGSHNLSAQVGYFTVIAGHELDVNGTIVNGTLTVPNNSNACIGALDNFTRGINSLTLNVPANDVNYFRTSQACPIRNLKVQGSFATSQSEGTCNSGPGGYSSGGYIANLDVSEKIHMNTQQQFYVRNTRCTEVDGGAWNIFNEGVLGVSGGNCPPPGGPLYTALPQVSDRVSLAPRVVWDSGTNRYALVRPLVQKVMPAGPIAPVADSTFWLDGGFHIWQPSESEPAIQEHLDRGTSIVLPARTYALTHTLRLTKPYTAIIGLGFATLTPTTGLPAIIVEDQAAGCVISGILVRAGQVRSDVLVQVGERANYGGNLTNPTMITDVFIRVGGPTETATATTMLEINQRGTIVDHTHLWRADHTASTSGGLGPTKAVCDHCMVVNGNDVLARGLFAEHSLKEQVVWRGNNGVINFYQSELPYDVSGDWDYPSLRVTGTNFLIRGAGVYSFFADKWNVGHAPPLAAPTVTTAIDLSGSDSAKVERAVTFFLGGQGTMQSVVRDQFGVPKGEAVTLSVRGPKWVCQA